MKVKMLGKISGVRDGAPWPAQGEEFEVPADAGKCLCESGLAEPVASEPTKTEKAAKPERSKKRGDVMTTKAVK